MRLLLLLMGIPPFPTYNYRHRLGIVVSPSVRILNPLRNLLLHLLALELGQTRGNISPLLLSVDQAGDGADDVVEASADLLCRVAVAQRECVVLDGLEVDGDAEGSTELVVALDGVLAM